MRSRWPVAIGVFSLCLAAEAAVAETAVTGIEGELLSNVLAFLTLDDLACDTGTLTVARAIELAPEEVRAALNAYGFYSAEISTELTQDDDCWQVDIQVDTGEPVHLRNVSVTVDGPAAELPEFQVLLENAALLPGAQLRHPDYDNLKRGLTDLARNRGFAEAVFTAGRIDIYPEQLAADVELAFESGPRYSVGAVTVNQNVLEPDFVAAFFDLSQGVPYDNRLLTSAFLDLNNSGYFSTVDVSALPPDAATRTIPVEIDLVAAAHRTISYGVGFSTDTGPRFRFGRSIRRFNQQGHQLSIDGQLSPVVSEITSIYRMPMDNPRNDWLNFSLGAKREETDTSLARSIEAGIRRIIDRSRGWSRTQFVNYVVEDFEVGSQTGRPHLLIPGIDWTRIRGDDAIRPQNGSRLYFEIRGADDSALSDTSFVQATASVKWIRSIAPRTRVLLRGAAGYLHEDNFAQLPPSIRYFAGGDTSIRGFDFESLGPVDSDGAVIGGTRLFVSSVELERDIKPRWSVAFFVDHGNAFDEHDYDGRTGAGIGTRWRSPLGPVRLDIAWPVNDLEHGPRLHISLGPDL